MLEEKILQNKHSSAYHHGLDEIFQREEILQKAAAREFMSKHFKKGLDPGPQLFEKGTVTAMNMVSAKYGHLSKAEKFQQDMANRQRETIS